MNTRSTRFPGFTAPAVGFEQPFEMLAACHERVQRSLDLLRRLLAYIDDRGHDASTRSAAADVLRYFDIAAPLHHEDEEQHVFPPLLAHCDARVRAAVRTLQREHREMAAAWAAARPFLLAWTDSAAGGPVSAAARATLAHFAGLYAGHIEAEERLVYPAARAGMDDGQLALMGRAMQARRQT